MTIEDVFPKETIKPWGKEVLYVKTKDYVVKELYITKGHRLSLQYHDIKEESWYFVKGNVKVTHGNTSFVSLLHQFVHVPPKTIHRLEALEDSIILEVSTPHLEDICRIEDDYNRI